MQMRFFAVRSTRSNRLQSPRQSSQEIANNCTTTTFETSNLRIMTAKSLADLPL